MLAQFGPMRMVRLHEVWWGGFFPLLSLLPFIAIIVGLVIWSRGSHRHHHLGPPPPGWGPPPTPLAPPPAAVDPALNEARLRYARGEISRDDYLRIAGDLTGQPPPSA